MAFHVRHHVYTCIYYFIFPRVTISFFVCFIVNDDIEGVPLEGGNNIGTGFIPSKWETVDPEQIEAQAVTTSEFYTYIH